MLASTAGSVSDWMIAAGTLGAVLVSLWVSVWRDTFRRPSLSLIVGGPADKVETTITDNQGNEQPVASVRLRVKNKPGRRTARDVQVLLDELIEPNGNPRSLSGVPFRWASYDEATTVNTVPPGIALPMLLFWVEKARPDFMFLGTWPNAGADRDVLDSGDGEWKIRLALTARDAPSSFWDTTISYDGTYDEVVLSRINVSPPTPRRRAARS